MLSKNQVIDSFENNSLSTLQATIVKNCKSEAEQGG